MTDALFSPFTFASGAAVPNRIVKAAMEESLATPEHLPGEKIFTLYRTWAQGGTGTLITGNVMVHDAALTGPRTIVLDEHQPLDPFRSWAAAAHEHGAKIWMQISHPGRQIPKGQPGVAWAPSAKTLNMGTKAVSMADPTPMTEEQIHATIKRFITTARLAEEAGFDGIEIHAAHGYLLSQFLSPLANIRTDDWGGSLENRARILLEIVKDIRATAAPDFVVAVKLNSADFQRGGFELDDAKAVINMLAPLGVDLVELSGGNYESPAMTGASTDERTLAREAYFLDFTKTLVHDSPIPLMVTGGVVRRSVAEQVLDSGMALVGIATALAADPQLPNTWQNDQHYSPAIPEKKIRNKTLATGAAMAWVRHQISRLADGKQPQVDCDPRFAFAKELATGFLPNQTYGKWTNYGTWLHRRMTTQHTIAPKSVLMVVTAATEWTLKNGEKHPTGFWAEELAVPHKMFTEAGWKVTIATPCGMAATLDKLSLGFAGGLPAHRKEIRAYLDAIASELSHPTTLADVNLSDYDIVFYPGGHGPMEDLAIDETSGALLRDCLESGKPLALLCHAPAAILAATNPDGSNAFSGRTMTALSNREELLNPFAWKAQWLLEDELKQAGITYIAGIPLRPHVVVDGNLYTGQNPQSSHELALRILADQGSS